MYNCLKSKFMSCSEIKQKLIDTGNKKLVENNWWGDTYWGICKGKGLNKLGQMLMEIRDTFTNG